MNFYLIIGINKIQLDKSLYLAKQIQQFANWRQRILVWDSDIVKTLIIYIKTKVSI